MSDSLQPNEQQHTRLPCPSLRWLNSKDIIESVIPSSYLFLCWPLLLLPLVFSSIRVFSRESALCIKWPKYWSFSISPSNEYSGFTNLMQIKGKMCAWHTLGTLVNAVYTLRFRQPLGSVFSPSLLYSSAPAQATSHCVNLHSYLSLAPDFSCPAPAHITSMASHHPWERVPGPHPGT